MFKAEVALGSQPYPAEHAGYSEALGAVGVEVGRIRRGQDDLIGRPRLRL
jgi:hypothetical protein